MVGAQVAGRLQRGPLAEVVWRARVAIAGGVVTQWNKDALEAAGLIKLYVLALQSLDLGREAVALVRRHNGRAIDLDRLPLDEALTISAESDESLLVLDEALDKLAEIDPQAARIVELRYFAGLTIEETAEVLKISPMTVKREWATARAWLHREIAGS